MMIFGIILALVFVALILWLAAEWKARLPFRILAGLLFLSVSFFVVEFCFISPLRLSLAGARSSHYGSARSIISLLGEGEITKVTNALTAFIETEKEWDVYPSAAYRLMKTLAGIGVTKGVQADSVTEQHARIYTYDAGRYIAETGCFCFKCLGFDAGLQLRLQRYPFTAIDTTAHPLAGGSQEIQLGNGAELI